MADILRNLDLNSQAGAATPFDRIIWLERNLRMMAEQMNYQLENLGASNFSEKGLEELAEELNGKLKNLGKDNFSEKGLKELKQAMEECK